MEWTDDHLIERLRQRDEAAFEHVFKTHFKNLHHYAFAMLKDEVAAEEMVQQVYCKLWERHDTLSISGAVAAYLYRSVHNESLNYLKHLKVRREHQLYVSHRGEGSSSAGSRMQLKELEGRLHEAMNSLPEQCRTIFQLSRYEELRYREIADRLQLSVKTVENQMGKALRILREHLADFLVLMLIFLKIKS